MRPAPSRYSAYPSGVSLRRRAVALFLALVANILMVAMLLRLAPPSAYRPESKSRPLTFQLLAERAAPTRARTVAKAKRDAAARRADTPLAPPATKAPAPTPASPAALNMMIVSKEVLDATDTAMRAPHGDDRAAVGAGTDMAGQDSGAKGAGEGPGGEHLYNAEWYTEPTRAELSYYIPSNAPHVGWGMIACRTVANYRVDDCVELGQSPPGSGFARAVRLAAWQFRVRPPRIGDHRVIGAWVRIRIDYTETGPK